MKRTIAILILVLAATTMTAQTPFSVRMNLFGDYKKAIYQDTKRESTGYSASIDLVHGHFLYGAAFDNGIRNKRMSQYNLLLSARTGYVLEKGTFSLIPYVRAGWFMDMKPEDTPGKYTTLNQFLYAGGAEADIHLGRYVSLAVTGQVFRTSLNAYGFSLSGGIVLNLYQR